ncbi:Zinc finger RING-type [Penicillium manginii]|uniref:Zinc finger RING-type n=1 Tax=Penicillium manginii TaxID=203109 RepID=UPI002547E141|nr:Zinc finger RING-type [Penicillium manginii]KAJ5756732.1 Zinc finger RING-type [Penicillium manginii]
MASEQDSQASTPRSFAGQSASAEEMLKSQTVGLVHLSDFRKRRAEVLEQKEREAHDKSLGRLASGNSRSATPSTGDVTDGSSTPKSDAPPKKKKKKALAKSKLSFGDDHEDTGEESAVATPRDSSISRSGSKTPNDEGTPSSSIPSIEAEAATRDALRKEFLVMQEAVKNTEILIPFVLFDGTSVPAGSVKIKKGDPIWLFLDRCRKVGAELGGRTASGAAKARREWARVSVDDLMLVKGDVIVPHHYEFYYFIANRVQSFSKSGGLLFDYSDKPPPAQSNDKLPEGLYHPNEEKLEGFDKDAADTKVVDRRWYEKNKHIYPASLWNEYEPGCAGDLGLAHPTNGDRRCPACSTVLSNPDDAVSTILNPTEDYKTSVLSGLDPNTIMECAGRALGFWAYQSTQEIFYQEFLGKSLTEKYAGLSTQMDKVIHNANSEIATLHEKVSDLQDSREQLEKKNQELINLNRERSKKLTQITNLYNILKARAMRTQLQNAASDTVTQTINTFTSRTEPAEQTAHANNHTYPKVRTTSGSGPKTPVFPMSPEGVEQLHRYQRSGTGSSKQAGNKRSGGKAMAAPTGRLNWKSPGVPPSMNPQHRTRLPQTTRQSTIMSNLPSGEAMLARFGN